MELKLTSLSNAAVRLGWNYQKTWDHKHELDAVRIDGRWFIPESRLPPKNNIEDGAAA